jgi:hypothetical protein
MHCANFKNCVCCCGLGCTAAIPAGLSLLHRASADWYAGEELSNLPVLTNIPLLCGSGKFGTPCERMHCANLISAAFSAAWSALDTPPLDPPAADVPLELVDPMLAKPLLGELLPQPAARTATLTTDAAIGPARHARMVFLACICVDLLAFDNRIALPEARCT